MTTMMIDDDDDDDDDGDEDLKVACSITNAHRAQF
jgi:hypothetical protein